MSPRPYQILALAVIRKLQILMTIVFLPTIAQAESRHGIAMHGEPAYSADFQNFSYVNPDAPMGGELRIGRTGSFDTLNPFTVKGKKVWSMRQYVFESLMTRGWDEPFTLYGLIAESIDVPEDRSSATFHINPRATFSDGEPILADDVVFSWDLLRTRGRPNYRSYYSKVMTVETLDDRTVRFNFGEVDRELPLIIGLMPVLPSHAVDPENFERTTLDPPIGSGPYIVDRVDAGRSVTYRRRPDYWGRDLAVMSGRHNFDTVRIDWYRDSNALFAGFKTGDIAFHGEGNPVKWDRVYDIPVIERGDITKATLAHGRPSGMMGFVFNLRRPAFEDIRVRQALSLMLDFDWINNNLFGGSRERIVSHYTNSVLETRGPITGGEAALLDGLGPQFDPETVQAGYTPPLSSGNYSARSAARRALRLLNKAGWSVEGGVLTNAAGEPFRFAITLVDSDLEKIALTFADALKRIGIVVDVRTVDSAQYQRRLNEYDYDMIVFRWTASLSPGNEQAFRWSSEVVDNPGSFNYAGVRSPVIDRVIEALVAAGTHEEFVTAVHALDRALMAGYFVIPLHYDKVDRVARWFYLGIPEKQSLYGYQTETWWDMRPAK